MQTGSPSHVPSHVVLHVEVAPSVEVVPVDASTVGAVTVVPATVQQSALAAGQPELALISARHSGPGAMQVPPAAVHALPATASGLVPASPDTGCARHDARRTTASEWERMLPLRRRPYTMECNSEPRCGAEPTEPGGSFGRAASG